ncbi:MAG: NAD(P)-dependent oxidoreductase [Vampirovibrionia bacterium]
MKIMLFGTNTGIGLELTSMLGESGHQILAYNFSDMDIRKEETVNSILKTVNMDLIIYLSGYEKINEAEKESQLAYDINATGALNLSKVCKEKNIPLMYLSTSYVFDGTKPTPYDTKDAINPLSEYGKSKAEAEKAILETIDKHYIIRTNKMFGVMKENFIDQIIEKVKTGQDIKAFDDLKYTPTWTFTLAKSIDRIITSTNLKINYGLYHCTNSGVCSDFNLIADIMHSLNLYNKIYPVKYAETQQQPALPLNSVLNCSNTPGIIIHWIDALHNYLMKKGYIEQQY